MKRGLRLFFVTSAVAIASRAALGCATDGDPQEAAPPATPGDDASVVGDAAVLDGATLDATGDADAAPNTCSADGWCYTSLPTPGSYDASALPPSIPGVAFELRAVWVAPDHKAWAVSSAGHVMQWTGTSWRVETIAARPLRAVWGWGTTDVWVTGERGLVLHGTIAGGTVTFQSVTISTTQTIGRIVGTSATDVWAIADGIDGSGTLNRVFRLDAAGTAMVPTTVPSTFTDSTAKLRLTALWTAGTDFWVGGYANTCGGPGKCNFRDELVTMKWNGGADGGAEAGADGGIAWDQVSLLPNYTNFITAGAATNDGVQLLTLRGDNFDDGLVMRVARDASKLDAGAPDADAGPTQDGDYAWTNELAVTFGSPEGVWATNRNDVWLVGRSGTVRHYDGKGWNLVRLSLSNVTPLLSHLHGIHGVVDASGAHEIWVVGDDVAIHKTVKP